MKWIKAAWPLAALTVFWAAAAFGAQKGQTETLAPLVMEYIEISGAPLPVS